MRSPDTYFWRTSQQQEIDYIEIEQDKIHAYEFKWNPTKKGKFSDTFTKNYDSINHHVHRENYREFLDQ